MNFQHLRFAIAVAETGSFTNAAEQCCVTQPALSNAIGQLETELGAKLFERTTRFVRTTDFGETMIEKMREVVKARFNLLTSAADYLARDDKSVRIGLSPLISSAFSKTVLMRSGKAGLNIVLTEMNKADIAPALHSGTIDFGLCPTPLRDMNLHSKAIYSEPLLFVSDCRNESTTTAQTLEDLSGQKVLLVSDDCGLSDTVRILFEDADLALNECEGRALGYNVLERWSRMGIGVTILPMSQVDDMDFAKPLKLGDGRFGTIEFGAFWTPGQEKRTCFETMLHCFSGFQSE